MNSFEAVFRKTDDIYKLFFLLTKKLSKFFSISRASLIVHSKLDGKLKAIAMKGDKGAHEGLALTLPEQNSLLYNILESGVPYIENYPQQFPGNFIEEKILIDSDTRSLAVLPIKDNGTLGGLICFASPVPYAFTMLEDGLLDDLMEKFGPVLNKKLPRVNI